MSKVPNQFTVTNVDRETMIALRERRFRKLGKTTVKEKSLGAVALNSIRNDLFGKPTARRLAASAAARKMAHVGRAHIR
jgi:hypothetical protein